jgi:hypothetical protein
MRDKYASLILTVSVLVMVAVLAGCAGNARLEQADPGAVAIDPCQAATFDSNDSEVTPPTDVTANRGWPETVVTYQPAEVKHLALYLHEPVELWAVDDGRYGLRLEDVLAMGAEPVMFAARIALIPVEAFFAPPWQEASSPMCHTAQEPSYVLKSCPSGMTRNDEFERDF